jgi:hypothetical protein
MKDLLLDVGDDLPGVLLVSVAVQGLGYHTELDDELAGHVRRFNLTTLLLPKPNQRGTVDPHNYACIRAADKAFAVPKYLCRINARHVLLRPTPVFLLSYDIRNII